MEEKLKGVKSLIRSVLISNPEAVKRGIPAQQLLRDYKDITCELIPYRQYGCSDITSFARLMPDTIQIINMGGEPLFKLVSSEGTKHIENLVARQRTSKKKSSKGKGFKGFTRRPTGKPSSSWARPTRRPMPSPAQRPPVTSRLGYKPPQYNRPQPKPLMGNLNYIRPPSSGNQRNTRPVALVSPTINRSSAPQKTRGFQMAMSAASSSYKTEVDATECKETTNPSSEGKGKRKKSTTRKTNKTKKSKKTSKKSCSSKKKDSKKQGRLNCTQNPLYVTLIQNPVQNDMSANEPNPPANEILELENSKQNVDSANITSVFSETTSMKTSSEKLTERLQNLIWRLNCLIVAHPDNSDLHVLNETFSVESLQMASRRQEFLVKNPQQDSAIIINAFFDYRHNQLIDSVEEILLNHLSFKSPERIEFPKTSDIGSETLKHKSFKHSGSTNNEIPLHAKESVKKMLFDEQPNHISEFGIKKCVDNNNLKLTCPTNVSSCGQFQATSTPIKSGKASISVDKYMEETLGKEYNNDGGDASAFLPINGRRVPDVLDDPNGDSEKSIIVLSGDESSSAGQIVVVNRELNEHNQSEHSESDNDIQIIEPDSGQNDNVLSQSESESKGFAFEEGNKSGGSLVAFKINNSVPVITNLEGQQLTKRQTDINFDNYVKNVLQMKNKNQSKPDGSLVTESLSQTNDFSTKSTDDGLGQDSAITLSNGNENQRFVANMKNLPLNVCASFVGNEINCVNNNKDNLYGIQFSPSIDLIETNMKAQFQNHLQNVQSSSQSNSTLSNTNINCTNKEQAIANYSTSKLCSRPFTSKSPVKQSIQGLKEQFAYSEGSLKNSSVLQNNIITTNEFAANYMAVSNEYSEKSVSHFDSNVQCQSYFTQNKVKNESCWKMDNINNNQQSVVTAIPNIIGNQINNTVHVKSSCEVYLLKKETLVQKTIVGSQFGNSTCVKGNQFYPVNMTAQQQQGPPQNLVNVKQIEQKLEKELKDLLCKITDSNKQPSYPAIDKTTEEACGGDICANIKCRRHGMRDPNLRRHNIKRGLLPKVAIKIMERWYEQNIKHPYPSQETAEVIAQSGGINIEQVKKWFANKRMRNGNTRKSHPSNRSKRPFEALENIAKKLKLEDEDENNNTIQPCQIFDLRFTAQNQSYVHE